MRVAVGRLSVKTKEQFPGFTDFICGIDIVRWVEPNHLFGWIDNAWIDEEGDVWVKVYVEHLPPRSALIYQQIDGIYSVTFEIKTSRAKYFLEDVTRKIQRASSLLHLVY